MNDFQTVDVLLVEDSDADAEMILRALRKGGLVNRIARLHDGVEALAYIFREGAYAERSSAQPKLILLDLKMPRLSGIDVLRRLKANPDTKTIPVVMLTSSAEESDSYLVKPVNFSSFTDVVVQAGLYWAVMNRLPN
jgi:two-component system response regulator